MPELIETLMRSNSPSMSNSSTTHDGAATTAARPAPEGQDKFDRLKEILREMFQLDRGDLDFGLYRIMRMKAAEIEAFLDTDLLPQVKTVLEGVADEDRGRIEAELDKTIKQLKALKAPTENNEKVIDLRKRLAEAKEDAAAEAEVYNHLANFFDRYYDEGDFMPLRRYTSGGKATYLIPYDGEEVKLHWANADQYYIKTTENYASYAFTVGEGEAAPRVRFEIAAADNEKDNIKEAGDKQRRFVLAGGEDAVAIGDGDLIVRFEHRPLTDAEKKSWRGKGAKQQDQINEESASRIEAALERLEPDWRALLNAPAPTDANPARTVLSKHIERYTAKNSFDYFIHKDLGGFLRRELDFYLKNEVLNLGDLSMGDTDLLRRALARMRAVRHVAEKIIAFLAQLEDFQKRLWLKKKFVLETHWCVTLDQVPVSLYPEIAANDVQWAEWVDLFAIDEIEGDLDNGGKAYSEPLTPGFLSANPHLVLDTRHFSADFTERLLATLSDAASLDERTDGLLVHGENFQALNLLQTRYSGNVKCIYNDPPYNTSEETFIYKNQYKHSSWMSMIYNSLHFLRNLLSNDGSLTMTVDDEELYRLKLLLDDYWGSEAFVGSLTIQSNPRGRGINSYFATSHDYAIYYAKNPVAIDIQDQSLTEEQIAEFPLKDEVSSFRLLPFRRSGGLSTPDERPNSEFSLFVDTETRKIVAVGGPRARDYPSEYEPKSIIMFDQISSDFVEISPQRFFETFGTRINVVMPVDTSGERRVWRWSDRRKILSAALNEDFVVVDNQDRTTIQLKDRIGEGRKPKTVWYDSKYDASSHGTSLLKKILGKRGGFGYPKSIYSTRDAIHCIVANDKAATVLDSFSGSGTTGHAVIDLNRQDAGRRKYIMVEMGEHCDQVMLLRLKKVVYAPEWKEGKPESRDKGVSQLMKYVRLESYEDTLDGLVLTPPDGDLLAQDAALAEDYRLRYAFGAETVDSPCLSGENFADPFAYTLSVVRDGVRCEAPADLPETFNYLLGLRVESRRCLSGVLVIAGRDAQGQSCLILWRNLEKTDNDALEAWLAEYRQQLPDSLDLVYVNGDHTLNAIRQPGESWTAETIEPRFRELMFEAGGA